MPFEIIDLQDTSGFQSIKIPAQLKIDDNKAYLKKVGNALYIIPFHNPWQNLIDSVDDFTQDFMEDKTHPGEQKRDFFE